jgi:tetratricopeptide (TPR) repeat protein
VDAHYVARLERGAVRWPGRDYRAAFAAVLGRTPDELGFRPPRRSDDAALPPAFAAVALAGNGNHAADADAFDRLAAVVEQPGRVDTAVVEHLAAILARQRQLEDVVGAARVLPAVLAEVELIERLAPDARGLVRVGLIRLASEYRQFAGWMGEDSGDPAAALAHYDRAADAAGETGDTNMITSVWSLKSHLAWSQGDAARAVGTAEAGQRDADGVSPGVLALIAQQQARGHALDGDAADVDRLLDVTEELTATAAEQPDAEPPWIYFNGPDRVLFQRGVAYVELGRHAAAVDLFAAARDRLPAGYRRDHGRYAANLALAAALDGQVDRAASVGREALTLAVETGSTHTMAYLRRMRRARDRFADSPEGAEFDAAVASAGRSPGDRTGPAC